LTLAGVAALAVGLALGSAGAAGTDSWNHGGGGGGGESPAANLNFVHGIPGLNVDI